VSPKSRGRPPGRGRPKSGARGPKADGNRSGASLRQSDPGLLPGGGSGRETPDTSGWQPKDDWTAADEVTDCWFDDPVPEDRHSWAIPSGHGRYRGIDINELDPADEDELGILMEAVHADWGDAIHSGRLVSVGDHMTNPRLHVALHQVVANQVLADEPPETWQTVRRMTGLGYDWHNIMHMIAGIVSDNIYGALTDGRPFDRADYARRLSELPGNWPPPEP
jgi:Domain of unknown function (DUF1841)